MEKALEKGRLPQIDSIEGLARFWDAHELTDFEGSLQEVKRPVFVRAKGAVLTVSLKGSDARRLKKIASARGVKEATLLRQWIVERLHDVSALDRPHNQAMQLSRSTAKPGRVRSGRKKRSFTP